MSRDWLEEVDYWGHALKKDIGIPLPSFLPISQTPGSEQLHALHHESLLQSRPDVATSSKCRSKTLKVQAKIYLSSFKVISPRYSVTDTER